MKFFYLDINFMTYTNKKIRQLILTDFYYNDCELLQYKNKQ